MSELDKQLNTKKKSFCPTNDLHELLVTQSVLMYSSVVEVKMTGLSFSKLSFKVASLTQRSDMFTNSCDMVNKNTLGVKKCEAYKKQPYLCATKSSFDIS